MARRLARPAGAEGRGGPGREATVEGRPGATVRRVSGATTPGALPRTLPPPAATYGPGSHRGVARGIDGGTKDAERSIRYVTKYVTKDVTEHVTPRSDAQRAHYDRMHAALSTMPCSPTCANWLLYGIQPDNAKPGLVPGRCTGKVHQRRTLGFSGRRVLISRQWSGKTLADHRADNRAWIRAVMAGAIDGEGQDQAATPDTTDGPDRYRFELAKPGDPDVPPVEHRILRAISTRIRWRQAFALARERGPGAVSATQDPPTAARAA